MIRGAGAILFVVSALPQAAPQPPAALFCEAESFLPAGAGWQAKKYGENYYVGTFANTFLSRKAFLGAPEQSEGAEASLEVRVPAAGRYLALVRYEAVYRFETRFRLRVEQGGKTRLDRLYGARENLKIWAFGQKLKKEVAWDWGASENIVWEGHDATVELQAGPARLTLATEPQPEPAARRNVDLVLLTRDEEDVKRRIEKENYLPLDGLLTQEGDLFVRLHAREDSTLTVPNGTEHSPYWVHLRTWKPKSLAAKAGASSDWVEVGSLLDTLSDGQWNLALTGRGDVEFGVPDGAGVAPIRRFENVSGALRLAYDADTRVSRRLRPADDVLYDLVDYLKKNPVPGTPPVRTLVYGYTFDPRPDDPKYTDARAEFLRLIGATAISDEQRAAGPARDYIDVRGKGPQELEKVCEKLKAEGRAGSIACVSLGDEIGLAEPRNDDHAGFRAWLKEKKLQPADLGCADWDQVLYTADRSKSRLYYHSRAWAHRYGIARQKELTDVLRKHLPNAGIGANFSPHHGAVYLGETHKFVSLFREGGMTMPWGEDYIFQMPVASPQVNFLQIDLFRAAVRGSAGAKIHMYVMPHWPGNTPAHWRRMFYGAIAHGVKVFNLFEFRPVQAAYTENHVSLPETYREVRRALHELGPFEDIVQDGQVRRGSAALWFSEAADAWDDARAPFGAEKRCLYLLARHVNLPFDAVVEGDDLWPYEVLFLADRHVSRAASRAIAAWVRSGGRLLATAGAGMRDEYDAPNEVLAELFGVKEEKLEVDGEPVRLEKQDLPFEKPVDTATWSGHPFPAIDVRSRITAGDAEVLGRFTDGSPAVTLREVGGGQALYCAFLPGLGYVKPAIPLRPVDRGHEGSMAQLIPSQLDAKLLSLVRHFSDANKPPLHASHLFVETSLLESDKGSAIVLINWSGSPVKKLHIDVRTSLNGERARSASGTPVLTDYFGDRLQIVLDLDVADAVILR
jgi:hypothetical protein